MVRAAPVILFSGAGIHQFPMPSNAQTQEEIRQRICRVYVPSCTPAPREAKTRRRTELCSKTRMVFVAHRPIRRRTPPCGVGVCLFTPERRLNKTYSSGGNLVCRRRRYARFYYARSLMPARLRSGTHRTCPSGLSGWLTAPQDSERIMNMALRAFNKVFPDEDAARAWFGKTRWPNGPHVTLQGVWQRRRTLRDARKPISAAGHMGNRPARLIVSSFMDVSVPKADQHLSVRDGTAIHPEHCVRAMMTETLPIHTQGVESEKMNRGCTSSRKRGTIFSEPDRNGTKCPPVFVATERREGEVTRVVPIHG